MNINNLNSNDKLKLSYIINCVIVVIMIIFLIYLFGCYIFYYDDSIDKLNLIKQL